MTGKGRKIWASLRGKGFQVLQNLRGQASSFLTDLWAAYGLHVFFNSPRLVLVEMQRLVWLVGDYDKELSIRKTLSLGPCCGSLKCSPRFGLHFPIYIQGPGKPVEDGILKYTSQ